MNDWRRLREKLHAAATTVTENDGRRIRERLNSAHLYALEGLSPEDFPDGEGKLEFEAIEDELARFGEMVEGAGSVPRSTLLMSDEEVVRLQPA